MKILDRKPTAQIYSVSIQTFHVQTSRWSWIEKRCLYRNYTSRQLILDKNKNVEFSRLFIWATWVHFWNRAYCRTSLTNTALPKFDNKRIFVWLLAFCSWSLTFRTTFHWGERIWIVTITVEVTQLPSLRINCFMLLMKLTRNNEW